MTSREQGKRRTAAVTAGMAITAVAATVGFSLAAREVTLSTRSTSATTSDSTTSDSTTTTSGGDTSSGSSDTRGSVSVSPSDGGAQASSGGS